MRKLLLAVAAVSMASIPVALPTVVKAQGASADVESCISLVEEGAFDSIGQCVSAMRSGPVPFCRFLKDIDIYPIFLYDPRINDFQLVENQGQCVSLIHHF